MKKVKKFLSNHEEDFNPKISLDEIKNQITFKEDSRYKWNRSFFDLKLILSILITILIVVPTTIFLTGVYTPTNIDDPNTNIHLYLDKNFDSYLLSPIESELINEHAIISFYYGKKDNAYYVITFLETKQDYSPNFKTNNDLNLKTVNNSISTIKLEDNEDIIIDVSIEYNDETINKEEFILPLSNYKNLL